MQCMFLNTSDASQVGYPHQILGKMEEKHQTQFQGDKVKSTMPNLGQNNKWNMKVEAQGKKAVSWMKEEETAAKRKSC